MKAAHGASLLGKLLVNFSSLIPVTLAAGHFATMPASRSPSHPCAPRADTPGLFELRRVVLAASDVELFSLHCRMAPRPNSPCALCRRQEVNRSEPISRIADLATYERIMAAPPARAAAAGRYVSLS